MSTPLEPSAEDAGGRTVRAAWVEDTQAFGAKLLQAVIRFVALLVFFAMHEVLSWIIRRTFKGWPDTLTVLDMTTLGAFVLLYVEQLLEMLAIFIPRFENLRTILTGNHNGRPGGGQP